MATKKAVKKTTKTAKKPVARKTAKKSTVSKAVLKKQDEALYFWGGIMIAICATGAFIVLALGISQMIQ